MNLHKYYQRMPRYTLQPLDNTFIRVAGPQQTPWEEGTDIRDISLSGLAFTAPKDLCPELGEILRIQFEVPGGTQLACYAMVSRIDNDNRDRFLVGIKFQNLDPAHKLALLQGLARKLKEQKNFVGKRKPRLWSYYKKALQRFSKWAFALGATIMLAVLITKALGI